MQRAGIEWAFRMTFEPRRFWRRYLVVNPVFIVMLAGALVRKWWTRLWV
jgi:N-acetylglucosaminyldiphosphoundecaprenol N-acetyl-beta-D-mannosaminyltransferase